MKRLLWQGGLISKGYITAEQVEIVAGAYIDWHSSMANIKRKQGRSMEQSSGIFSIDLMEHEGRLREQSNDRYRANVVTNVSC
jgi:glycogen synthase